MLTCDWYNVEESPHSLRADVTEPVLSDEQFCEVKGHLTRDWPLHLSTAISILRRDQPDLNHAYSKSIALRNTGKENVKGGIWKHFVIGAYHVVKHYCHWISQTNCTNTSHGSARQDKQLCSSLQFKSSCYYKHHITIFPIHNR